MQIDRIALDVMIATQSELESYLNSKMPEQALSHYIEKYTALTNRTSVAIRLLELLLTTHYRCKEIPVWPDGIVATHTGALLVFAVAQLSGQPCSWNGDVPHKMMAPTGLRTIAAKLWLLSPDCKPFIHSESRKQFVAWLTQETATIPILLLVAAKLNDSKLVSELADPWRKLCLMQPNTPEFIENALPFSILQTIVEPSISLCIGLHFQHHGRLFVLMRSAFKIERYDFVVSIAEILARGNFDPATNAEVQAMRLGAFGALNKDQELITAYRRVWLKQPIAFPYPEMILYNFQRNGEWELERHVLNGIVDLTQLNQWFALCHRQATEGPSRALLSEWAVLFSTDKQNEQVLFGLSRCLFALLPMPDKGLETEINARWQRLATLADYREMAGFFLVFLAPNLQDLATRFESNLATASMSHPLVVQAGKKYMRALSDAGRWSDLRNFLCKTNLGHLGKICQAGELAFHLGLAGQVSLPNHLSESRKWLQGWEQLLSLRMQGRMILRLIAHFLALAKELKKTELGDLIMTSSFYEDITLQLQRRSKAEGLRVLMGAKLTQVEKTSIQQRLLSATKLDIISEILGEMAVQFDLEEEAFI